MPRIPGAGGGSDAAERRIRGGPNFGANCVAAEDWPPDVVGADEGGDAPFDHGEGSAAHPDVFSDQRAGGFVVFGDAIALAVEDGVDGDPTAHAADRLPPGEIVFVADLQDGERAVTRVIEFYRIVIKL